MGSEQTLIRNYPAKSGTNAEREKERLLDWHHFFL
jgi:hypothetical protein